MAISQSITVLPTPPSRADPDNFDARADGFLGALPTMQTQMNTWAGQANSTATTVNNDKVAAQNAKTDAESARDTASGHASTASGHASTATTQAGTATTQAGIATTQAGIATTQAGIATTQAGLADTARQGAEAARDDAVAVVYGTSWPAGVSMTEVGYLDGVTSGIQGQLNDKAAADKGVTGGDSHDHSGGDGAQIAYSSLSGLPSVGKILQIIQASGPSSDVDVSSDSWVSLNLSASITPSSASSKILVLVAIPISLYNYSAALTLRGVIRLLRGSTELIQQISLPYLSVDSAVNKEFAISYSCIYLDSPNTTSATTYSIEGKRGNTDTTLYLPTVNVGTITLMEVAA